MAEAIISGRGSGGEARPSTPQLSVVTVTQTSEIRLDNPINNTVEVLIFGGGGGGNMNWSDITIINANSAIQVTIGSGGAARSSGGTSSFGQYLSATGGETGINNHGGNGGNRMTPGSSIS